MIISNALKVSRLLNKKTMEVEILKEAAEYGQLRKWIAHAPLLPKDGEAPSPEEERDALREEIVRLNQEIRRQQMELDILKKAEEIIKKDPGISINSLSNREKTKIVDALRETYPLAELLSVLALARSSYFYHRTALHAGDK